MNLKAFDKIEKGHMSATYPRIDIKPTGSLQVQILHNYMF